MIQIRLRLEPSPDAQAEDRRRRLIQRLIDRFGLNVLDWSTTREIDPKIELVLTAEAPSHAAIQQLITLTAEWVRQRTVGDVHVQIGRAAEMSVSDFPLPAPGPGSQNVSADHV